MTKIKKEVQARLAKVSSLIEEIARGPIKLSDVIPVAMYIDDLLDETAELVERLPDDPSDSN